MKRVSTTSLAAALIFGGSTVIAVAPVAALQEAEVAEEFNAGELSDGVRAAVVAAQTALEADAAEAGPADTAAIQAQLEAAIPLIQNEDDRFIIGQVMLQNAARIQQQGGTPESIQAVQLQALELSLASNRVPIASRASFWLAIANASASSGDDARAATAFQNVLRYDPSNGDALIRLADSQFGANDHATGYATASRAFQSLTEAGVEIPSSWHAVPFRAAYQTNDVPRVVEFGVAFLRSHPTAQNWNEVLRVFQTAGRLEDQANLDLLRLMRATNGLDVNSINEYVRLAALRGFPREAQVIYEGSVAGGAIPANQEIASEIAENIAGDRSGLAESETAARSSANGRVALNTADAYASYGETAKALELYQLALDKGGVDAGVVNLRRGATYYAAGQTDQARAAFEAVTGDRAPHAAFWLQWLDEQAGASSAPATAEPASAE
ncbi:tetratricopeptide repeat protein [Parasphingopyxis lamellibrachiae]|uniref:Tetratricopeptide repeat protein n=1 Tax=Parasphingopyxis lamellibrachiae TaxID=680125 RepID=A0A3D9FEQ9_9SPHN|nr:tetratricopeptide repeat protein [Parasphingopyxis lamellibrachiae]RED15556.1 tetratricopeptide repeat protein [Parasphingopyxis lamellibrachiae]